MNKKELLKKSTSILYLVLVFLFLYLPIILVVVYSFSNNSNFTFSKGFTLDGYREIFAPANREDLFRALKNTFVLAIVSSIASTILGSIAAVGIHQFKPKTRMVVDGVNQMPVINSETVMAVSFMLFFMTLKFPQGWTRLILGHITFCTPYVVLSVLPRLASMDNQTYEAALDLGASPIKALFKVVLPYILPGIISGFAMAFTISIDDFIITQFNKGSSGIDTLSTYLYSSLKGQDGMKTYWFPVSSIIILLVITVVLIVNVRKSIVEAKKTNKSNQVQKKVDVI
ncbi:MAG: ABC transporter permease [Christensenellales bacterium]|jgi:spermidine/putrescine transport system permease protein|nr:ABC transporter permease [Clostridiales bacterium]